MRGVFKIYDELEPPHEGACSNTYIHIYIYIYDDDDDDDDDEPESPNVGGRV